jgi:outer membrane protein assembly factor BamE (lipoprotein component of BamABCDE complex)
MPRLYGISVGSAARTVFKAVRRAVGAVVVAALLGGCTIGRYYTGAPLHGEPSALVEGQSTKSDVLRIFGPPTVITHQTDGDAFVYSYQQENTSEFRLQDPITGVNWFTYSRDLNQRDRMVVIFDFAGVVREHAVEHHVEELPAL